MKRFIFTLLFTFHFSCAFAGDELELFKKDISNYLSEQNKTPHQIIKYSDSNGEAARAVLNPDRVKRFIDEIRKENDYPEKLKAVLEQYKPISQNYMAAFNQSPGQYDAEYLDHFDFLFQLMVANASPTRNLNLDAIKDEGIKAMLQATAKIVQAMPSLLLVALEKQIQDKKFSEAFTPHAIAKLNHLREIQAQVLQAETSHRTESISNTYEVVRADFGLFNPPESGKPTFIPAKMVPLTPGQSYGWIMALRTDKPKIRWREEFSLPAKPDTWGPPETLGSRSIKTDGRVSITEREVSPDRGIIFNSWAVAPGDPKGRYVIRVFIENSLTRVFEFDVQ